jgi:signal transduction histidine kinase
MRSGREWPSRERWIDVAWVLFTLANLGAMALVPEWETVPFHFIWVSLTILYGFHVWRMRPTVVILALVMASTGALITVDVVRGGQPLDELTEVPLMAAMFAAMVWHARRRLSATAEAERVSMDNLRLLDRERRFVQDASHELRTPITVALGHAELIERRAADPTIADDAAVITDELMRLRRLADRLLLLASSESLDALHTAPVGVAELVVATAHRWSATPRNWRVGFTEEAFVLADADRLAVALDAVIENAVQHTDETDMITLGAEQRAGEAVIWVHDTGAGIAAADLGRIFDRFARSDPGRSRHAGGFGLGLPIVQVIVEAHHGTVSVESAEGSWTRVEIKLPASGEASSLDRVPFVDRGARDPVR